MDVRGGESLFPIVVAQLEECGCGQPLFTLHDEGFFEVGSWLMTRS